MYAGTSHLSGHKSDHFTAYFACQLPWEVLFYPAPKTTKTLYQ